MKYIRFCQLNLYLLMPSAIEHSFTVSIKEIGRPLMEGKMYPLSQLFKFDVKRDRRLMFDLLKEINLHAAAAFVSDW